MTSSRPLVIGLAVSAAVNVFLIGGLAGMTYVRLTAPPPPSPVPAPAKPPAAVPLVPAPAVKPAPVVDADPAPEVEAKPRHHAKAETPVVQAPPPVAAPPPQAVIAADQPARARPPLASAGDVLSPETRRAFRRALADANKKNKPLTQQARAERQAALNALGQPGYDAAEVSRRLSTARSLDLQARGNVEAALATFASSLTPQERVALADALEQVYAPARPAALPSPN